MRNRDRNGNLRKKVKQTKAVGWSNQKCDPIADLRAIRNMGRWSAGIKIFTQTCYTKPSIA